MQLKNSEGFVILFKIFTTFAILQVSSIKINYYIYHCKGVAIPLSLRYYKTMFGEHSNFLKKKPNSLLLKNFMKLIWQVMSGTTVYTQTKFDVSMSIQYKVIDQYRFHIKILPSQPSWNRWLQFISFFSCSSVWINLSRASFSNFLSWEKWKFGIKQAWDRLWTNWQKISFKLKICF